MVSQNTIKDIAQSLKATDTQKNNTHQAVVSHIDREGVVWVNVAGSEVETPTEAIASEVNPGDAVTVEWRNNKLYIAGNYSDPSAGMARTVIIQNVANQANDTAEMAIHDATIAHDAAISATESAATAGRAASVAQTAAEAAQAPADTKKTVFIAQPTPPYHVGDLWAKMGEDLQQMITSGGDNIIDSSSNLFDAAILTDATIYVCTNPKLTGQTFAESDWELATADTNLREWFWHDANGAHVLGDETGYRNDITSTGMKIVDTSTETSVAEFGSNGATIGLTANDQIRSVVDSNGMKIIRQDNVGISSVICHLGYGPGKNVSGGTSDNPYFTLGIRDSGSVAGNYSFASGTGVEASGFSSHAEGANTTASERYTHAEGLNCTASKDYAHAEGYNCTASDYAAHAEGSHTTASGQMSHAEGTDTVASAHYSHAQNLYTIAASSSQTSLGKYNIEDANGTYAVIIGNGTADNARSNALTVDWSGNVVLAGGLTVASPTTSFSGTVGTGLTGSCNGIYDALSKTVRINFQVRKSTDIATSDVLFTIPSAYRPSAAVSGSGVVEVYVSSAYRTRAYEVTLNTSGEIKQGYSSYARSVFGVFEYSL